LNKKEMFLKAKNGYLSLLGFDNIINKAPKNVDVPNTDFIVSNDEKSMIIGFKNKDPQFLFNYLEKNPKKLNEFYIGSDFFLAKSNNLNMDLIIKVSNSNIYYILLEILDETKESITYKGAPFYLYAESPSVWCIIMHYINNKNDLINEEYRNIKSYMGEKQFTNKVKSFIKNKQKIIVFVEGETDEKYINKALKLLKPDLLKYIEIKWVGKLKSNRRTFNTGKRGLDSLKNVLSANPELINNKIILLYDSDTNKPKENFKNLYVRKVPFIENRKITKGIENLFENHLISEEFYSEKEYLSEYGERKRIEQLDKMKLCDYLCNQTEKEIFKDFESIIKIFERILSKYKFDVT
jgi:hypothetical protein